MLCGRYEGFDDRVRQLLKPDEISIGDYILGGGEVAGHGAHRRRHSAGARVSWATKIAPGAIRFRPNPAAANGYWKPGISHGRGNIAV